MAESSENRIADLLAAARGGDDRQKEQLFEACRGYLQVVARAQVETWIQGKVDASDIVQQTMMEAHRDFERFSGKNKAEWLAWLKRILAHNAADFVRHYRGTAKRQERREVRLAPPADKSSMAGYGDPPDPGESPSQQAMRHDDELRLAVAMTELSPDHAEVIMLRNLQRLPFDQVAKRMGRTRPATQMLWMRAIKNLQKIMEAE